MRGKGKSLCIPFAVRRITPAYAGKSRQWYIDLAKKRDHPRLCGEKNFINRMKRRLSGSPPPMRGKDATIKFRVPILGITPAYAGKSFLHPRRRHTQKDHPRLCGEKPSASQSRTRSRGSPPPMRGKEDCVYNHVCDEGITPAYAGKSHGTASRCGSRQDHPRLCGEKNKHHTAAVGIAGSPPPMRGKGCNYIIRLFAYGITPAYAGKSASTRSAGRCTQDHPRLCGEKAFALPAASTNSGSPPPMRGQESV